MQPAIARCGSRFIPENRHCRTLSQPNLPGRDGPGEAESPHHAAGPALQPEHGVPTGWGGSTIADSTIAVVKTRQIEVNRRGSRVRGTCSRR